MPTTNDRRVHRTRDRLHHALVALILEKGYGRVTVQDILDRADVGRSTFYDHYRSKDDLFLASGLEHLRVMLDQPAPTSAEGPTPLVQPALTLFRLADDNRPLYRALIGKRGSDLVLRQARTMLTQAFTEQLRARLAFTDDNQLELTAEFLANGLVGLLVWWLDSQTSYSAEEMYARFERLVTHGIQPPPGTGHPESPTRPGAPASVASRPL